MRISGNDILVIGGATGICVALVEVFLRKGNKVIICGRRKDKLDRARLNSCARVRAAIRKGHSRCLMNIKKSKKDS